MEGVDDKHSVIGLMKDHTEWPEEPEKWPLWVKVGRSVDEILTRGYLSGEVKASHVTTVGVMLDADDNADGRYQRIQQLLSLLFPALPPTMPIEGLVSKNDDDKRFGVWLMPDNLTVGDLETFLRYLVPDSREALWSWPAKTSSMPGNEERLAVTPTFRRQISIRGCLGRTRRDNRRVER